MVNTAIKSNKFVIYTLYPEIPETDINKIYAIAIDSNSKNADRIVQFLNFVQSSQENYDLMNYGIKEQHYSLDNDKIKFKSPGYMWEGVNCFLNIDYIRPTTVDPINIKEFLYENIENQKSSSSNEYELDYSEVESFLKERSQQFSSLENDILTGNFSVDINDFIEKQRLLGIDKVVNELQTQLNQLNNSQ